MPIAHFRRWPSLSAALFLIGGLSVASAEVPPRQSDGLTLIVPEAHAALGRVYYVQQRTADVQVTFTSEAPFERFVGTSLALTGYMVIDEDPSPGSSPLLCGGFRLPVASFDTGIPNRNRDLRGPNWLDGTDYPDIIFELVSSRDAKIVEVDDERGFTTWSCTLEGEMTIRSVAKKVEVPARFTLMPDVPDGYRGGGDLLALRCKYRVELSDYGIDVHGGNFVSEHIDLDQFLLMTATSPTELTARLFPGARPALVADVERFALLLTNHKDPHAAYELGRRLLADEEVRGNAKLLSRLASAEMNAVAARKDLSLALEASTRAAELTDHADPLILNTPAKIHYELGHLEEAVTCLRQIMEHADKAPPGARRFFEATLEQYETELKAKKGA